MLLRILLQLGITNLISLKKIEKQKPKSEIDFHKYRKPAFLLSWLVVLIGSFTVYSQKDKILGIDFRGGEEILASFENEIDSAELDVLFKNDESIGEVQHVYRSEIGSGESSKNLFFKLNLENPAKLSI